MATAQSNITEYMESIDTNHSPGRAGDADSRGELDVPETNGTWDGNSLDPLFTSDGALREPGYVTVPVEFRLEQHPPRNIWEGVDPIGEDEDADGTETCPKCGTDGVSMHTVEQQTRAADESGTQVTKTSCGCTIRRTD
ncbi:hypothetical protein [Halorubrum halodurans]|uniref:TFIIS-type domain-containing protein n=1 Tax=Halorubrum halodurans TaxID=1383851 RepID=A0A256IKI2_9EURY|nr:hypothetical protein [Halorubrum halodurans]OYR56672.1 hypothetical protein DJ70_08120 [Halorubrum halodurans]